MKKESFIVVKSLKEQVYEYLQDQINRHNLKAGSTIDMEATSKKLGISKTPLRDALIQLETEGFVTISPRRGIYVNILTLQDIRESYQVIGALESSAISSASSKITRDRIDKMDRLNREMKAAVDKNNFPLFYKKNLDFHHCFLDLCQNKQLIKMVTTLKKRLYDFPAREEWVKEWEESSIKEHQQVIDLLAQGDIKGAAQYIHDVHWSFSVQEKFILQYYFPQG